MNETESLKKESRWAKLTRSLKKGARLLIPVAAGWAAGIFFPPAGAALYGFLKEKINKAPISMPISDDTLKKDIISRVSRLISFSTALPRL